MALLQALQHTCTWESPPVSGMYGRFIARVAQELNMRSSVPTSTAGFRMVAVGNAFRTASSPAAYARHAPEDGQHRLE